ncbi:MAG: sigma-70 family RNA polymerase sigma factor, partial [Oscillospiraceae bacterium]|nr:sigma-70 family RNA polymerase sigma factor [Oscillospiraceae bacterium]
MSNIRELAEKAAGGDGKAFDELYEMTKNGVWFTCKKLLKNEENAKDVMQDTYLAAFENFGSLTDFGGIQSWLNKIAANKCKNYIKSKTNIALAENSEELLENIPDDRLLPEEYVTDMAKRRIIMDIIERSLSEDQYRTIILYYLDEMTAAEIAELMDCHEKTVLYRLKVARLKIKEEVMRYEEENKDKLHGIVFVPTLTRLFRIEAENISVPNVPI